MKQRLLFYLACFLIGLFAGGCSTPKKLTCSKQETAKVSESTTETTTGQSSLFVDTTKTTRGEVIYRKIEFYPPEPSKEHEPKSNGNTPEVKNPNKHPHNTGAIKSIETLTIKGETEQKGVREQKSDTTAAKTTNINSETEKAEEIKTQPAPDPYRYRYIFGILTVVVIAGTAAYFWLRKTKVFISVVSFLKSIF